MPLYKFSKIDDKFFDFNRYSGSPTALDDFIEILESLNRRIPSRTISYVIEQLKLEEEENPKKNYNKKQFLLNLVSCNLSKLNGQECASEFGIKYDTSKTRIFSEESNKKRKTLESFLPPIKGGRRKTQRKYRKRKNTKTIKHRKRRKH
jgi:sugar diacid utilization regulator